MIAVTGKKGLGQEEEDWLFTTGGESFPKDEAERDAETARANEGEADEDGWR